MKRFSLALCLIVLFFSACASSVVHIPEDITPLEIIQRAQEASDRNRYKVALQHYEVLLERNPDNMELQPDEKAFEHKAMHCLARYEIAFIHYKQKKYAQARMEFESLLNRYNAPDGALLPPKFKLLSEKVLERINEKKK
ncbi:MAG: hypothetical protein FWD36_07145 [Treponema sp.]|nr:hypothetical protein [Treponema sp.]